MYLAQARTGLQLDLLLTMLLYEQYIMTSPAQVDRRLE